MTLIRADEQMTAAARLPERSAESRASGDARATPVLQATLATPSFRVPDGILTPGTSYFASIAARSATYDGPGFFGSFGYPYAVGTCLTDIFTP